MKDIAKAIRFLIQQAEEYGADDVAHILEVAHLVALETVKCIE